MIINQKEIVLLPFPFSDLEGTRVRPALVISNNELNKKYNTNGSNILTNFIFNKF